VQVSGPGRSYRSPVALTGGGACSSIQLSLCRPLAVLSQYRLFHTAVKGHIRPPPTPRPTRLEDRTSDMDNTMAPTSTGCSDSPSAAPVATAISSGTYMTQRPRWPQDDEPPSSRGCTPVRFQGSPSGPDPRGRRSPFLAVGKQHPALREAFELKLRQMTQEQLTGSIAPLGRIIFGRRDLIERLRELTSPVSW
jgi:hypothetical protein